MKADVIFHELGHETVGRASDRHHELHDLRASCLALECALNGLELASQASYTVQELRLFANRVGHEPPAANRFGATVRNRHRGRLREGSRDLIGGVASPIRSPEPPRRLPR